MKQFPKQVRWQQRNRVLLYLLLGILLAMLLGALTPTKWTYSRQTDCQFPIYVSSVNHFHAEIILPVNNGAFDWRQHLDLNQLGQKPDQYQYLSFGWGDQKFFTENTINPITIIDALLLPGASVMHVWGHRQPQMKLGEAFQLKQVFLGRGEYLKLTKFIKDSFQLNANQQPHYLRQGLYPDSAFYTAQGTYSILRTCNDWTAEALRLADINTPVWPSLAPAVMHQLKSDCSLSS
jgi:uncharacterized protein (TIGR02117 family)